MKRFIYILLCAVGMTACQKGRTYFPKELEPQQVEIVRFDKALMNVRTEESERTKEGSERTEEEKERKKEEKERKKERTKEGSESIKVDIKVLYDEYPEFMPMWVEDILGIPSADTAYLMEALPQFLNDTLYGFKQTNAKEQEVFADITDIQNALNKAFTRILWLYPDMEIPTLYLFISGFNASIYFHDELIGIGADMYLGSDYPFYNRVVYEYQKQTMRPECIPVDVVSAYLFRHIPYTGTKSRLLDQMLYRGKIMYLTAQIFDDLPGYEVMGWTKEQWNWCERNERAIWHLVMDKRDLFKTENLVLTSYLNDGPFTAEVSQDSPGRLGIWLGWRIAESYMAHNEDVSLQQLMAEGDAQKILELSLYKP